MGFPKHYIDNPRAPSSWAATVGAMKARGTDVKAMCQVCDWKADPVDLGLIIEAKGAEFSLFDVLAKCPACGKGVRFFYRPAGAKGTPYRPCLT